MVVRCIFRKVPGPSESVLKAPGPSESVLPNWSGLVGTCLDKPQLVATCRDLSQLVATPVALRDLPWIPIPKDFQAYCHLAASFRPAGCSHQAGGPEGWEADLARSTAEGVGGSTMQLFRTLTCLS